MALFGLLGGGNDDATPDDDLDQHDAHVDDWNATGGLGAVVDDGDGFFSGIVDAITPEVSTGSYGRTQTTGQGLNVATFSLSDGVDITEGGQNLLLIGAALAVAWIVWR